MLGLAGWEGVGEEEFGEFALAEGDDVLRLLVAEWAGGGGCVVPLSRLGCRTASACTGRDTSGTR
jgi:hypothetical protein